MDFEAAKETLAVYLKEKRLRTTPERFRILEEVMQGCGHFDADELYTRLRNTGSKISRATVYNSLEVLVSCGIISRYRFGENHSRYEQVLGKPRHDHLICLGCGEIIEFVIDRLGEIEEEVCRENKFKPQHSTLQIFGYCENCQKK